MPNRSARMEGIQLRQPAMQPAVAPNAMTAMVPRIGSMAVQWCILLNTGVCIGCREGDTNREPGDGDAVACKA